MFRPDFDGKKGQSEYYKRTEYLGPAIEFDDTPPIDDSVENLPLEMQKWIHYGIPVLKAA